MNFNLKNQVNLEEFFWGSKVSAFKSLEELAAEGMNMEQVAAEDSHDKNDSVVLHLNILVKKTLT